MLHSESSSFNMIDILFLNQCRYFPRKIVFTVELERQPHSLKISKLLLYHNLKKIKEFHRFLWFYGWKCKCCTRITKTIGRRSSCGDCVGVGRPSSDHNRLNSWYHLHFRSLRRVIFNDSYQIQIQNYCPAIIDWNM